MLKKKLLIICFSFLMIMLFTSCGSRLPFDPRLYNSDDSTGGVTVGPDIEITTNPFENFTDPNENFISSGMNDWAFRATFDDNNVPTFWYDKNAGAWQVSDASINEYKESNAPDSTGGGYSISSMVYYMYNGVNPFFDAYGSYNSGEHGDGISRFLFYRFTGKGGGVASLDNMLVAIDTYTKLVFCFGVPTSYETILGNKNPKSWGSVDSLNGGMYKFYEYDPAGIVAEDGTIELYDWYTTAMGNGNYEPPAPELPTGREVATYGRSGRSPYYTVSEDTKFYTLSTRAVSLENIAMRSSEETRKNVSTGYIPSYQYTWEPEANYDYAYIVYNIRSAVYPNSSDPSYNSLANVNDGDRPSLISSTYQMPTGYTLPFNDKAVEIPMSSANINEMTLELDARLRKFGKSYSSINLNAPSTASDTYSNGDPVTIMYSDYADEGGSKIIFTYDETQEAFVYDSSKSKLNNGVTISGDTTISANRGIQTITINYSYNNIAIAEIVYEIQLIEDE